MQPGYILTKDHDFEVAQKEGYPVKVTQHHINIYPIGRVTGYSSDHISINGKRVLRSSSTFEIADTTTT